MKGYFNGKPLRGLYFNGDRVGDVVPPPEEPDEPITPTEDPYHGYRPSDWLPMPMPNEDEMYFLMMLPETGPSYLSFLATTVDASDMTVEVGTVVDGEFVSGVSATVNSGIKCEITFNPDDFGNLTSDGYKQAMVKLSGNWIKTWSPDTLTEFDNAGKTHFKNWNVFEIACNLPNSNKVSIGLNGASYITEALSKLRFYAQYGSNYLNNIRAMFSSCRSLIGILDLDLSNTSSTFAVLFSNCYSLKFIPDFNILVASVITQMFYNCYSLMVPPVISIKNVDDARMLFAYNYSLGPELSLDIPKVTQTGRMFDSCTCLIKITLIHLASFSSDMFLNCHSLTEIIFDAISSTLTTELNLSAVGNLRSLIFKNSQDVSFSINISNNYFTKEDIISAFNSLPTTNPDTTNTITVTGNPCGTLDADTIAIAESKGWTVVQ